MAAKWVVQIVLPPTSPVREVAVRNEVDAPVKVKAPVVALTVTVPTLGSTPDASWNVTANPSGSVMLTVPVTTPLDSATPVML